MTPPDVDPDHETFPENYRRRLDQALDTVAAALVARVSQRLREAFGDEDDQEADQ